MGAPIAAIIPESANVAVMPESANTVRARGKTKLQNRPAGDEARVALGAACSRAV